LHRNQLFIGLPEKIAVMRLREVIEHHLHYEKREIDIWESKATWKLIDDGTPPYPTLKNYDEY
jgi:hypothetical protein